MALLVGGRGLGLKTHTHHNTGHGVLEWMVVTSESHQEGVGSQGAGGRLVVGSLQSSFPMTGVRR